MAKGKANSRAAEKKRLAAAKYGMKKTMFSRMVAIKTANLQEDPMAVLPSFKVLLFNHKQSVSTIKIRTFKLK